MPPEETIKRIIRVAEIVELDANNVENKQRMKEIISLVSFLKREINDTKQELDDIKDWMAYDLNMTAEDFDQYWRQVRVNLYK